jgi:hypothetical protein
MSLQKATSNITVNQKKLQARMKKYARIDTFLMSRNEVERRDLNIDNPSHSTEAEFLNVTGTKS